MTLGELFNLYNSKSAQAEFLMAGQIMQMQASHENRTVNLTVDFARLLPFAELQGFETNAAKAYELNRLTICPHYSSTLFDLSFFPELVNRLRAESATVNGFFDHCEPSIEGETLTVRLFCGGADLLKEAKCDKALARLIHTLFDLSLEVHLLDEKKKIPSPVENEVPAEPDYEAPPLPQELDAPQKDEETLPPWESISAPKVKKPAHKRAGGQAKMSPVTPKEVLYGKEIHGSMDDLGSVTESSGHVVVWGSVFGLNVRDIRDGKAQIVSFNITDDHASIIVKVIKEKKKLEHLLDKLKNGITVCVRGNAEFDRYDRQVNIRAMDISLAKRKEKMDDAKIKRVELHLHTNMSAMDAVTPAAEYVKRAAKWGHKAIAITDHGVAQAFPDAMNAVEAIRKDGGNLKVIYGIEDYFINDTIPAVTG
ncbi:MAG TPA: PolC-type DNA polymerase III, partial [Ruminococcaceae bacterium]|nr:PolC-type DNA polymerase III [Oscillospiraceae bacterium]